MIVNQSALKGIFVGFNTIFNKVFSETETKYEKIATTVPSKTKEENYKWLGKIPSMREWIGDREIQNLSASDYTIKNKDYELTVGVDRNDIEDDTLGIYNPVVSDIAASTKTFPDKLVFKMLKEGFDNKCYDGQPFCRYSCSREKEGIQQVKQKTDCGKLCSGKSCNYVSNR